MPEQPETGGVIAPVISGFGGAAVGADEPNGLFLGPTEDPDRFELLGPGHAGGEGITWRGRFRGKLNAPVLMAVKQLQPPRLASPAWPTPHDVQRWTDQRHLLQTVTHDHLVRTYDVFLSSAAHPRGFYARVDGVAFTRPCLVMEWVEGRDLRTVINAGTLGLVDRLGYVRDIAGALAALHSATRTSGNPMLHRCSPAPRSGGTGVCAAPSSPRRPGQAWSGWWRRPSRTRWVCPGWRPHLRRLRRSRRSGRPTRRFQQPPTVTAWP